MKKNLRTLLALAALALTIPAYADVSLSPLFSDNAVLQRDIPIPVWGWDNPGQEVTVALDADTKTTRADATGHWSVTFDAKKAPGPCKLTVNGSTTAEFSNIAIGEVWFCSGQSNMVFGMSGSSGYKTELAKGNQPNIRTFVSPTVAVNSVNPRQGAITYPDKPGADHPLWQTCSPETLKNFSGVAYYFGRQISDQLDVPVGLITSARGGTVIEAWISNSTLKGEPLAKSLLERQEKNISGFPGRLEAHNKLVAKLQEEAKQRAATQPATTQPFPLNLPAPPVQSPGANSPSVLFNGMVGPVAPYAIRGAIWYQGESNSARPFEYADYLTDIISDWRKTWAQGDFPFLVIQLPNFNHDGWVQIREAQASTVKKVPHADYAVTLDTGANAEIHPANKKDPGTRLALVALKTVYGKNIIDRGPTFAGLKIDGSKAIVTFENTGTGLTTKDGKPPALFEIAGADAAYVPATAAIDGNTITLTNPTITVPVFVRFAWSPAITGFNFYNKEGLPAAPFRTDTQPFVPPPAKQAQTQPVSTPP